MVCEERLEKEDNHKKDELNKPNHKVISRVSPWVIVVVVIFFFLFLFVQCLIILFFFLFTIFFSSVD